MTELPQSPLVKIKRRGFMFVLSSPSGAGKTTLSRLLMQRDKYLTMSISCTTRPKRPGEKDGEDYHFVSKKEFQKMEKNGEFLESAEVFGHFYGTPKENVLEALEQGIDVLFDIDWQGTQQISNLMPTDVVSVFILPPSMEELELRLRKRAQDEEETVRYRMSRALEEISHWQDYDYVVVNQDLEESLQKVYAILRAERQKRIRREKGLKQFVGKLLRG